MRKVVFFISVMFLVSCGSFNSTTFSNEALKEKLVTTERDSITFQEILNKNQGNKRLIQVFASYCPVSQSSFNDVIAFQKENPSVTYIFISVDHSYFDWKRGLKNIHVKGTHYYLPKKGKGVLGTFLKLKTIPRFLVIDNNNQIKLFKSSSVSNKIAQKIK